MKYSIAIILILFVFKTKAQNGITFKVKPDICYKKGYLNTNFILKNDTTVNYWFGSKTLLGTESMFPDNQNINIYKKGALLFFIFNDKNERIEWFGLPPIVYRCKDNYPEIEDFIVRNLSEFQIKVNICLKKYVKMLKKGQKYSIHFIIMQNDSSITETVKYQPFIGTLKSNTVFFTP